MNFDQPHRRLNLLTGQWILVSPHRARRPWQGQVEKTASENLPDFDPDCYLCPGNQRSGGHQNPDYQTTFVFENDFSALLPPEQGGHTAAVLNGLFQAEPEAGICRVVCFSPIHRLTIPEMPLETIAGVIQAWSEQTIDLGNMDFIRYVQVFENKGAMMGASSPHPHSQIWATGHVPNEPALELTRQEAYMDAHGECLLCAYLQSEISSGERLVACNDHFAALVPYWAVWPFETMLVSRRHIASLPELIPAEVDGLADIMRQLTIRYDNLFEVSFPYSMGFHQAPCDGQPHRGWHLHAHYYPPLLRSATVRKFMVGFELLGMPQRDITPETAAERLRSLPAVHYKSLK